MAILNALLFAAHSALIALNLFGWMWKRTRKLSLGTIGLTIVSWFAMGAWKGLGYCWCTEVHWSVRRELGIVDDPESYVALLFRDVLGLRLSSQEVAWISGPLFGAAIVGAIWTNWRDGNFRFRQPVSES